MEKILYKKINLLIHLAKVDGKFDHAEKKLLRELLRLKSMDESYLENHKSESIDIQSLEELPEKDELFYWVLRLIKADGYLHPDEIAFTKLVAVKLGFSIESVDYFANRQIMDFKVFENELQPFKKH